MSETVYLPPKVLATLEPSESSVHGSARLSVFAVPSSAEVSRAPDGGVAAITFVYSGGDGGADEGPLDDETDPVVTVRVGRHVRAVLELRFGPPPGRPHPDAQTLRAISERLEARAGREEAPGARLSYILTARIIRTFSGELAKAPNR